MLIPKEAIKKLDVQGLEGCIIDCMMRAVDGADKPYRDEQTQNALNAARELKARHLGVDTSDLELTGES
jgi:hypothetical protein